MNECTVEHQALASARFILECSCTALGAILLRECIFLHGRVYAPFIVSLKCVCCCTCVAGLVICSLLPWESCVLDWAASQGSTALANLPEASEPSISSSANHLTPHLMLYAGSQLFTLPLTLCWCRHYMVVHAFDYAMSMKTQKHSYEHATHDSYSIEM